MEILVLGLLIVLNGFFALSEVALISSKKLRLEQYLIRKKRGAGMAIKLLEDSEGFLSAIQVGITLIGIITGVYGGLNLAEDYAPFFAQFDAVRPYSYEISLTLTILVITFISIVIGELVPKTIALGSPEKIAIWVAPAIYYFSILFYPFVRLLSYTTSFVIRLIGIHPNPEKLSEAELRHILKIASHEGVIEQEQNLMHEKIFYFSDKRARHIMTHRSNLEYLNIDLPPDNLYTEVLKSKHSKLLACHGNLDDFAGLLIVKEYLLNYYSAQPIEISEILHDPVVVPESAYTQKVISLFREKQNYFAVVVDEYGSLEGIITLREILENIIGDLPQEGEIYEPDVFIRDDLSVLVSGDAPVEILTDLIEDFTIDFEETEYATVAGFVFSQMDKIPVLGDKFIYSDSIIEVVDIDHNKVDKVLITKRK
ncbi:MAG TPA: hemolysin family protein [Prolixibacteraceae bacterium]|nr:hemolysin family protein [Prolixibacteraceae bacterium]